MQEEQLDIIDIRNYNIIMEEWKSIVGFEGIYSVSSLGRVRRDKKGRRTHKGKILKHGFVNGYPFVALVKERKRHVIRVHVLVARAFFGKRPESKVIDHINRNKEDNSPINLRYVSQAENLVNREYAIKRDIVDLILKEYNTGILNQRQLASKYKLHYSTISRYLGRSRRLSA